MYALVLMLLSVSNNVNASSKWMIDSLPGFPQYPLPFKLETGYVGVGELEDIQLFYYFIESENSPEEDPLVLWLTGGPGCSGLSSLLFEIGPLSIDLEKSSWSSTILKLNPYSWTKLANIIYLDAPVGSGFSYAKRWEAYNVSDTISAAINYDFLKNWLIGHPKFRKNPLYLAGDSYSGVVLPVIVQEITNGNEVGEKPKINLKGYMLGNPMTKRRDEYNSRIEFGHRRALISDQLYESIKTNCKGEYVIRDPNNELCENDFNAVSEERNYVYSYIWANDPTVQRALHIHKGSINEWKRCNRTIRDKMYIYDLYDTEGSAKYHRNLVQKGYQVLIFSGDQDLLVPYLSTQAWIETLNVTIAQPWRPWFLDGQVAGYTVFYSNENHQVTFATLKGGGHTAPEYQPRECFAMVAKWLAHYPL
nr:serine carboxypeptidase-like 12 [Ziziphus jujuba var. spinosa]